MAKLRFPGMEFQSLRNKTILWAFVFIVPILSLIFISADMAARLYERQIQANILQILTPFVRGIDATLENAKRYIANKNISPSLRENAASDDELKKLWALRSLGDDFSEDLSVHSQIDGIFLYDRRRLMFVQNYNRSYARNRGAANYLTSFLEDRDSPPLFGQGCLSFEAGGKFFMFIALDLPDGGAIGCWFDTDTLLGQIRDLNIDGLSRVMFAYREGHLMDASFNARVHELEKLSPGFFVVKENLSSGAFTLIALLDRNVVMASFIRLKRIIRAFSLLAVILFGAYIALLKKAVIRPLSRLVHAIEGLTEGLEDGNPQPIPVRGDECHEIRDVYRALNTMTGELETLKIRVYEEKLMTQNTRMQLFQLQIRPHFFMNALNTILSYAHAGEYELSGKMALCLAAHCRYILYNSRFAAVGEELAHTQNYVDMQNMQHGPRCRYTVQVKEELLDIEIPVLAVQIFVENALKHCRGTARTEISTLMEHVERDGVSLLHILIDDTGGGFDEDILARLNDADRAEQDEKDGIGIENIRRRLQILYGGDAGLMFSNNESGGARVEMYLPVERKKETERP